MRKKFARGVLDIREAYLASMSQPILQRETSNGRGDVLFAHPAGPIESFRSLLGAKARRRSVSRSVEIPEASRYGVAQLIAQKRGIVVIHATT